MNSSSNSGSNGGGGAEYPDAEIDMLIQTFQMSGRGTTSKQQILNGEIIENNII